MTSTLFLQYNIGGSENIDLDYRSKIGVRMITSSDEDEKIAYVNITSAITALGFPALMREYFRGYIGQTATKEKIETLREMSDKLNK